ncbi:unnamed protein product [Symbiodinium natans]|uniref:DUF7602 domain-containing protein n=1 Tax=Symbiodinium natans TaxID=878477 RepID=A0A812P0S7_9DINO|nr:unnamed protein product [Symbiodinium natans]
MSDLVDLERFHTKCRKLPLPKSLTQNPQKLSSLHDAILACIERLYRDKQKPFLGEVQKLLRAHRSITGPFTPQEVRSIAAVCASKPELFLLVPPMCGNAPCILLRKPPAGFEPWYERLPQRGFCEEEASRNLRESIASAQLATMRQVIEGLYADRIEPTLNEVQERLRQRGWSFSDAQQAVLLYACQKDIYDLSKPTLNKQIVVLLKEPPSGFLGWAEGAGIIPQASTEMEFGLKSLLAAGLAPSLHGGVAGGAEALQSCCKRSLGELRALLRVFILKGLLEYCDNELVATALLHKELDAFRQATPRTPEKKKSSGRIYSQI